MSETKLAVPVLLAQLVSKHHAQWVDLENLDAWLTVQRGNQVLLLAGDPVRYPEALDVAVVLPELRQVCAAAGRAFGLAVAVPEGAEALAKKFGSQRWPNLLFFRDSQYVTTLPGMHDWSDYIALVNQALDAPTGRAPGIGIPLVSSTAGTCH